jgi:prepilin-type N-terminal cleavage/methylation domain-containing protein
MHLSLPKKDTQRGFTIVELLIVIVVIGILAAITIVAYNGVQNRAHAASAQADATNTAKLLATTYATNGSYPNDLSTINNGNPMPTADGTTYAYHPTNSNANYCVTVTNGSNSFKVTDTSPAPTQGGCAGDGVGGVAAITNLTYNPNGDSSTVNTYSMGNIGTTISTDATTKYAGAGSFKLVGNNASGGIGRAWNIGDLPLGTTFTWSAYIYSTTPQTINGYGETTSNTNTYQSMSGPTANIPANTWTKYSWSGTSLQGTGKSTGLGFLISNGANQTLWVDNVMATTGSTVQNYADGNTANWIWNGTANNSTSTGPPQ